MIARPIKKWLIIALVALIVVLVSWHFISRQVAFTIYDAAKDKIEEGKYEEAMQLARKVRWFDRRIGASIFAQAAELSSFSVQGEAKKALLVEASMMLKETDFSAWVDKQKYFLWMRQAALSAMLGNPAEAKGYAEKACQVSGDWVKNKPFGECLDIAARISFSQRNFDRLSALELYEQTKLNQVMEEANQANLKFGEASALITLDIAQARQLRDQLIQDHQFTEDMHASYCDDVKYEPDAKTDAEYCKEQWAPTSRK